MLNTPEILDYHRFPQSIRACITADTIGVSTGPQIRNRTPVVNSISTTPGDIGEAVIGAATVGTSKVSDANRCVPWSCRRQRNSWLACIPASRATADATAPGAIAAATMRSFSALDHLRRCRTKVTISPDISCHALLAVPVFDQRKLMKGHFIFPPMSAASPVRLNRNYNTARRFRRRARKGTEDLS